MAEELIRSAIKGIKDYVPGKTPKEPGIIKLASNENPFGPSPKALAAIIKEEKNLHIYPDQKSILLREALANKLGLLSENIIIGNGSDDLMQIAASTFLQPGEEVVIPENTFSVYEHVARIFGGSPVFVALKNKEQDLSATAKAISPKTKIVFLCNPHNPTGSYINQQQLEDFLTLVPKQVLVILDEAYVDYVEAPDFPNSLEDVKRGRSVFVLRTFSKFYGLAGLRVGYGVSQPELVKYMLRAKMPFNVSRLAQAGAQAALEDADFAKKTYKANTEGKQYLYAELDTLGLEYKKTGSNFVFINVKRSADELFLAMMRAGVIIRPLTSFGFPAAIRVSIGTMEQNKKFVLALKASLAP